MKARKHNKRLPLISERLEIRSDPFLHDTPEVKSRLISQLNALMFREKLNALRRQYPGASRREIHNRFLDLLRRISQRQPVTLRVRG